MKMTYDPTADALYIQLNDNIVAATRKVSNDLMVDLDEREQTVGIEILRVRQTGIDPFTLVSSLLTSDIERPDPAEVERRRAEISEARKRRREAQKQG